MDDAGRSGTCTEAGKKDWTQSSATIPNIYLYKHTLYNRKKLYSA